MAVKEIYLAELNVKMAPWIVMVADPRIRCLSFKNPFLGESMVGSWYGYRFSSLSSISYHNLVNKATIFGVGEIFVNSITVRESNLLNLIFSPTNKPN